MQINGYRIQKINFSWWPWLLTALAALCLLFATMGTARAEVFNRFNPPHVWTMPLPLVGIPPPTIPIPLQWNSRVRLCDAESTINGLFGLVPVPPVPLPLPPPMPPLKLRALYEMFRQATAVRTTVPARFEVNPWEGHIGPHTHK